AASGDLMIFQGPVAIDWEVGCFDDGAVEDTSPAHPRRLANWLSSHVHVAGRPEWEFLKLHTHDLQNRRSFLSTATAPDLTTLASELVDDSKTRLGCPPPSRLHYVTAREAYNIPKAAEAGCRGDPNAYRDFAVPPPANRRVLCPAPWRLLSYTADRIRLLI